MPLEADTPGIVDSGNGENAAKLAVNAPQRVARLVFGFYLCFFLLLSSGRLASVDAGNQLRAAMLLVNTGSLGTPTAPKDVDDQWILSADGRYYQAQDIGNKILMLPAAALGSMLSHAPVQSKVDTPPVITKVGVSLTYAVLSAIACWYLFRLLALFYPARTAFLFSLALPTTTFFWGYTKSAWDVLGACCFVCPLLYCCALLLRGIAPTRNAALAGLFLACACAFRFSLAPFFAISLAAVLYFSRRGLTWRGCAACAVTFFVGMLPSLVYNTIRMGSPLRPGTTAEKFMRQGNTSLGGSLLEGVYGLLISPNRGVFIFAPILLLLFGLPFVWRKIPTEMRQLTIAFGTMSVLYLILIAKLKNWGAFGWGPRYLVPILPVLFCGAIAVLGVLWSRYRVVLIGLLTVSFLASVAPAFVNWHLVSTETPLATDQFATLPRQQIAVWHGLFLGLQGKPLPMPPDIAADPIRSASARFPDMWTVRVMERSRAGFVVGLTISLVLLLPALWNFRRLMRCSVPASWHENAENETMAAR